MVYRRPEPVFKPMDPFVEPREWWRRYRRHSMWRRKKEWRPWLTRARAASRRRWQAFIDASEAEQIRKSYGP